jgi:hypothetical protein
VSPCSHRALPRLPLYYELVRLPLRHTPALPLRLVGGSLPVRTGSPKSLGSLFDDLPWSQTPVRVHTLTFCACFVAGFQYMNTLASYVYKDISGLNPFTCVWPTIPFPLAPQAQLPSPAQSSVLARWLAFGQAGSSSSLTSVLLGALMESSVAWVG